MKFFTDFAHDYQIDILSELPGNMATKQLFYYPGANTDKGKDGLIIQVIPSTGTAWIGIFAFGTMGISSEHNGVYSCPDSKSVCIVVDGTAFLVNTEDPKDWHEIPCCPVINIKILATHNILLLVSFTEIIAWDKNGIRWKTERLGIDGVEIERIDDKFIYGTVECLCHPGTRSHAYCVDINTGKYKDGWT